ncbi:hypothetical protein C0431_12270 [bacterium]|nr:hypothetical protein [bacterium]
MDILTIGKAKKVKKLNEKIGAKLGLSPNLGSNNVAERVGKIEDKDPKSSLLMRIGDVTGHTAINLNKHNLRVQMLLDLGMSKLNESIVDTLKTTNHIDDFNSSGYFHDVIEENLKVESGLDKAIVRFKPEVTKEVPYFFFISKVGLRAAINRIILQLVSGVHNQTELYNGSLQLRLSSGALPIEGKWTSDWIDLGEKVRVLKDVRLNGTLPDNSSVTVRARVQGNEWKELKRFEGGVVQASPSSVSIEEGNVVQFEMVLLPQMEDKSDGLQLSYASDISTIDNALMLTLSDGQPAIEMKNFERMLVYNEKEVFKGVKGELTLNWVY